MTGLRDGAMENMAMQKQDQPQHPRVGVGVFVFSRSTQSFLLGLRQGSLGHNTWALPGGHLEFGESFEQCAARELEEETDLHIGVGSLKFLTATNSVMDAAMGNGAKKHYATVFMEVEVEGSLHDRPVAKLMEPEKCLRWEWVRWTDFKTWLATERADGAHQPGQRAFFQPMHDLLLQRPEVELGVSGSQKQKLLNLLSNSVGPAQSGQTTNTNFNPEAGAFHSEAAPFDSRHVPQATASSIHYWSNNGKHYSEYPLAQVQPVQPSNLSISANSPSYHFSRPQPHNRSFQQSQPYVHRSYPTMTTNPRPWARWPGQPAGPCVFDDQSYGNPYNKSKRSNVLSNISTNNVVPQTSVRKPSNLTQVRNTSSTQALSSAAPQPRYEAHVSDYHQLSMKHNNTLEPQDHLSLTSSAPISSHLPETTTTMDRPSQDDFSHSSADQPALKPEQSGTAKPSPTLEGSTVVSTKPGGEKTTAEKPEIHIEKSKPEQSSDLSKFAHLKVHSGASSKQAHATPRSDRIPPSAGKYTSFSNMPVVQQDNETEKEYLKRAQEAACQRLNKRLRARIEDKHATTSIDLLHALRKPMSADKETEVVKKVKHYKQLGESTVSWTPEVIKEFKESVEHDGNAADSGQESKQQDRSKPSQKRASKREWATSEEFKAQQEQRKKDQSRQASKRNQRWATNSEIKAQRADTDSNAWGSARASDISTETGDSNDAVRNGWITRHGCKDADSGLVDFEGKMMPPPSEWDKRPRMKQSKINVRSTDGEQLSVHLYNIFHHQFPVHQFVDKAIPVEYVLNAENHADGLLMAARSRLITADYMKAYYPQMESRELQAILKSIEPLTEDDFEVERITGNHVEYSISTEAGMSETSEIYAQRFRALIAKDVSSLPAEGVVATKLGTETQTSPESKTLPQLNIYLRPATIADLPQITNIYNHYVQHSTYPAEVKTIDENDMRDNFDMANEHKLPFIVAVERQCSKTRRKRAQAGLTATHPIQNTNPYYQAIVEEETIAGFAHAQDWTSDAFCERLSAEIEIYVEPSLRKLGVGACLMDKMMQICDRGYMLKKDVEFRCLPEKSHLYSEGGGRDLHKVYICVRTWSKPRKTPESEQAVKNSDREDEVELWIKPWLESWDFSLEGHLREVGARNGRYIDTLQFGRSTMYEPREGSIPDPLPGTT